MSHLHQRRWKTVTGTAVAAGVAVAAFGMLIVTTEPPRPEPIDLSVERSLDPASLVPPPSAGPPPATPLPDDLSPVSPAR